MESKNRNKKLILLIEYVTITLSVVIGVVAIRNYGWVILIILIEAAALALLFYLTK